MAGCREVLMVVAYIHSQSLFHTYAYTDTWSIYYTYICMEL